MTLTSISLQETAIWTSLCFQIFQCVVEDILRGLEGVLVYVDDILVFSKDRVEHDARMKLVLLQLNATVECS